MRSKSIAALAGAIALALPATAMAQTGEGGAGQAHGSSQWAETLQAAVSQAEAKQTATNTNAPVNKPGEVTGGSNSATQEGASRFCHSMAAASTKIMVARIAPLKTKVPIIQYLDLVLIWPPDSINEDSNIFSLFAVKKSYLSLDTAAYRIVPS